MSQHEVEAQNKALERMSKCGRLQFECDSCPITFTHEVSLKVI